MSYIQVYCFENDSWLNVWLAVSWANIVEKCDSLNLVPRSHAAVQSLFSPRLSGGSDVDVRRPSSKAIDGVQCTVLLSGSYSPEAGSWLNLSPVRRRQKQWVTTAEWCGDSITKIGVHSNAGNCNTVGYKHVRARSVGILCGICDRVVIVNHRQYYSYSRVWRSGLAAGRITLQINIWTF